MANKRRPNSIGKTEVAEEAGDTRTDKPAPQELVKATFYLTPENIIALEELKLKLRKQGAKVDKSELVRRAIDLLTSQ